MMIIASIIGAISGLIAVGIKKAIHIVSDVGFGDEHILHGLHNIPWWLFILVPTIGGLIVGPLIHFVSKDAKGSGVPEVMGSVMVSGSKMKPITGIIKAITSILTIGTGGSVGKEGPIVHVGSTIGSSIGQFLNLPTSRLKVLLGCGAASGIAAAFNAPVAGALFAIEVILMDFAISSFSPIVISAVIATVISHSFDGDFAAFTVNDFHLESNYEIIFYIILGGLTGLISFLFIKSYFFFDNFWTKKVKLKSYLKPAFGGLIIGIIGLVLPEILGLGYQSIDIVINNQHLSYQGLNFTNLEFNPVLTTNVIWFLPLILIFVKIITTSITSGSGGSGGIFAPSLFIGSMLGAFFGYWIHYLFPDVTSGYGGYALVAMGGLVASTTRAPITAILMVFELTKETAIILPLMLTCIGGVVVSSGLSKESIYTMKLLRKGIKIGFRAELNVLKEILVDKVYKKDENQVVENEPFSTVIKKLLTNKAPVLSVVGLDGSFIGIISLNDCKERLYDSPELNNILIAGDLADNTLPVLTIGDDCKKALSLLNSNLYDCLPVINRNSKDFLGLIWRRDIDFVYHRELEKLELTSDLADKIRTSNVENEVGFLEGYSVYETKIPHKFIGKTLGELKVRNKYGVDILTIKRSNQNLQAIPSADHILNEDDTIVIAGEKDKINKFKQLT